MASLRIRHLIAALGLSLTTPLCANVQAASFTPLGDLPGGNFDSRSAGVSDDGSVVIGNSNAAEGQCPFLWTPTEGIQDLCSLGVPAFGIEARAVSADGAVIAGWRSTDGQTVEGFRWSEEAGLVSFDNGIGTIVESISADGSVVVGSGDTGFRWTEAGGIESLGSLTGGGGESVPLGISADNRVIVGHSQSDFVFREAFRWTAESGMVGLGVLANHADASQQSGATAVSLDGAVIVGTGQDTNSGEAFRWTEATGMVGLGTVSVSDSHSYANAVSDDGNVVVGDSSQEGAMSKAFVWTPADGMQNLTDILLDRGATGLDGWVLETIADIAANGQWVVGTGTNPDGNREAFLANIAVFVDTDGDGVADDQDDFPNDPNETTDTDRDGIGNNADDDDDNDGLPDGLDDYPLGRFDDASPTFWAFRFIETLARSGITGGCGGDNYCPDDTVTRAQMAVFLERGINGSNYAPPPASGNLFFDVDAGDFAASFIEQLWLDGITGGCGNNNYCPFDSVTRAQMAVFLLRAKHGSAHLPPAPSGAFADVSLAHWAAGWIEQLAAEGITSGCGNGNYCPDDPVTRAQMAVFLVRAFGL